MRYLDLNKELTRLVNVYGIQNVEEELAIVKKREYPPLTKEEKAECLRAVYTIGGISAVS